MRRTLSQHAGIAVSTRRWMNKLRLGGNFVIEIFTKY